MMNETKTFFDFTTGDDPTLDLDDLDKHKGKWKTLWFRKAGGASKVDDFEFESMEGAEKAIEHVLSYDPTAYFEFEDGIRWLISEISYGLPIPIKE